jgi:hypothetical protein
LAFLQNSLPSCEKKKKIVLRHDQKCYLKIAYAIYCIWSGLCGRAFGFNLNTSGEISLKIFKIEDFFRSPEWKVPWVMRWIKSLLYRFLKSLLAC